MAEIAEALGELEESIRETEEDLQKKHVRDALFPLQLCSSHTDFCPGQSQDAFGKAKTECDEIRDSITQAESADEGIKNEIDELKQEIAAKKTEMRKLNVSSYATCAWYVDALTDWT